MANKTMLQGREGIYAPTWGTRTYQALHALAILALQEECSVILDASFLHREDRQIMPGPLLLRAFPLSSSSAFVQRKKP